MTGDPVALPSPSRQAEDQFIRDLAGREPEEVAAAVRAALAAGRPALAARAVGLLGETDEPDPHLDKARRAARFLLMKGGPVDLVDEQLALILGRLRKRRMKRSRRRQRAKLKARPPDPLKRRPLK